MFYSFASFLYPSSVYSLDKQTGESTLVTSPEINGFNAEDYVTEQVFYPSADGTKIPMFLTYKKDLKRDGSNPVYLYGYGGFNISLPPSFSPNRLVWLENGGIYAQANLRGGSEYGEEWHQAGTKLLAISNITAGGVLIISPQKRHRKTRTAFWVRSSSTPPQQQYSLIVVLRILLLPKSLH